MIGMLPLGKIDTGLGENYSGEEISEKVP